MTNPTDAVLPTLQRIQADVAGIRKDQKSAQEREINMADVLMETRDMVVEMRKDNLLHLGLTTKHRLEFEALRTDMEKLMMRVAALESRS
ncbi:hypothetical protein [Aestuariivirga sp.]|uniref:hypothetical protein n=1 Tax=Aestuariivirga sp. TaxID=2650926 RepID=UPI0039E2C43B